MKVSRKLHSYIAGGAAIAALVITGCAPGDDDSADPNVPNQTGTGGSAAGTGAAGMGAGGTDGMAGDAGFESTVQPFINKACNCHQSAPVLMAPFSLKPGEAYANLVNQPAMQLPTMMLIKPGDPEASYLWHKINGTQLEVGGMGMIMPYTFPLNADEKAIFQRWILAGAPP